jgi:hypothetical protein
MGFFRFIHKLTIGEDGLEYTARYNKTYSDIEKYNNKSTRTVSENRKLQLEQQKLWVDPKRKKESIINHLRPECTYTNMVGQTWAIPNHLSAPTEKHYNISTYYTLLDKKNRLDKFDVFEIFNYPDELSLMFLYVNRKELSEIILTLGGKKHQHLDEFQLIGIFADFSLKGLIDTYNEIEDANDEFSELEDDKIQEVYAEGIRYISIWSFKRIYGISPNTNEVNYINSEEIFDKHPSLETIEIKIENRKFEYVLGYPEKILIEYFNIK